MENYEQHWAGSAPVALILHPKQRRIPANPLMFWCQFHMLPVQIEQDDGLVYAINHTYRVLHEASKTDSNLTVMAALHI